MRRGHFLVTHRDGTTTLHDFRLEGNIYFAPTEACKWLKEKYATATKVSLLKKLA